MKRSIPLSATDWKQRETVSLALTKDKLIRLLGALKLKF